MNLKELLEDLRRRSSLKNEVSAMQEKVFDLSHRLNLDSSRRGENLRLLRSYLNVTQEQFVEALLLRSQGECSRIERGDVDVGDAKARMIELDLGLAIGWLDRNNGEALFLKNDEIQVIKELRKFPDKATNALCVLLKSVI